MSMRRPAFLTPASSASSASAGAPVVQFRLDSHALRDGVARSMAPRVPLACEMSDDIRSLSKADTYLIHALNGPYRKAYPNNQTPPTVQKHVDSIQYSTNAHMEHGLTMKLTSKGEGEGTVMEFKIASHPNRIKDLDTKVVTKPPELPVVDVSYKRTDAGCYKQLFENAYNIEQDWGSGAPYFSAIGLGLEAMLEASSTDFTGTQAMNRGNEIPLHNQMRFLISQYAMAVTAFKSTPQLQVLHDRARRYQAMSQ